MSDLHGKLCRAIEIDNETHNLDFQNDEERFMAWLGTVVRNLAINESRTYSRRLTDRSEEALTYSENYSHNQTYQPDLDKKMLTKEVVDYFTELFDTNKHPKHYKVIFKAFFIDGHKYEELSQIASIPVGTVKTVIFNIRKMCKKKFGNQYKTIK